MMQGHFSKRGYLLMHMSPVFADKERFSDMDT